MNASITTSLSPAADLQYSKHVNDQWVKLLSILGLNKHYVRCQGTELVTDQGEVYLDFLSGYGVYNVGHHHPYINRQLVDELRGFRPSMLQSHVPELAAELAERLINLAGGRLERVFFTSSGSEGIETVIKFARQFTKRNHIVYGAGGFHGLTCGALSLMSNPWWREGFGPLLPDTQAVPFGDIVALEKALKANKIAAFIIEPIQGESGIKVPPPDYLKQAAQLCANFGTLFVLDEVQTGMFRTGEFLAAKHFGVEPDMVVLAKAMSGGHVPVGAVLMRADIYRSVYSSLERAFIHASTFGENALAMRAALATLDVIEREDLGRRSKELGQRLRASLQPLTQRFEMIKEIRGVGLFNGIEFQPPKRLPLKVLYGAFAKAHPGLFGQMAVKHLFEHSGILTQMCGNNYQVIKSLPPLNVRIEHLDRFAQGINSLLGEIEESGAKFWKTGLSIAAKALGAKTDLVRISKRPAGAAAPAPDSYA